VNIFIFLSLLVGLVIGAALGIGSYIRRQKQLADAKMELPDKWLLTSRVLMTNEEFEVFKWLLATFDDHLVMVKLPVLRFTLPLSKTEHGGGARWQELLAGIYCTFTVCTLNGSVIGCVDVPGKRGLNRNNREVKEALLSDCLIAYTVVRNASLPESSTMRAAFLGEMPLDDQVEAQDTRGGDSGFHEELNSFKEKRMAAKEAALLALNKSESAKAAQARQAAGFNPDGSGAYGSAGSSGIVVQWEDSFIQSEDTRPSNLN
jgi:hypothetical protein